MSRKAFHLLLKKYIDGKCSPEEQELVDQWYELLDEEGLLLNKSQNLSLVEDRIWQKIQENIIVEPPVLQAKKNVWSAIPNAYKWVAAVLIVAIGISLFVMKPEQETSLAQHKFPLQQNNHFYTTSNTTNQMLPVVLMDKSVVQLQPGAVLSYPKQFAQNKREVYLDGAAFFKVSHNAASPFLVYTGAIVTQVLGTSFTIKKENNRFEVAVLTGKVAVYEEGSKPLHNKGGVVITPNEKVTYYSDNHHFITSLVDNPVIVNNKEDSIHIKEPFLFDETPMLDIIKQLEDTYAVQIMVENEKINSCLFSGNLSNQSLYSMLDVICQAIGANYEIRGTSIILTGNGCN